MKKMIPIPTASRVIIRVTKTTSRSNGLALGHRLGQPRNPAEFSRRSGSEGHRLAPPAYNRRSGEDQVGDHRRVAALGGDGAIKARRRARLSRQAGGVKPEPLGKDHAGVRRHRFAFSENEKVAGYNIGRGDSLLAPRAAHGNLVRMLERLGGPFSFVFLPEAEDSVDCDNGDDRHRHLGSPQHPGKRSRRPKQQRQQMEEVCIQFKIPWAFGTSRQKVGTKAQPARGDFVGAQSIGAGAERGRYLIRRQGRQPEESGSSGCTVEVGQVFPLPVPEVEKTLDHRSADEHSPSISGC
jgi:hypothetical protein